jgi:gamma-glutamyltranspeptidase / glutathione hydrolase
MPGTAGMPMLGALPVTVPGAVAGWFHLLERWGTRSFGELSASARDLAREGFEVDPGPGRSSSGRASASPRTRCGKRTTVRCGPAVASCSRTWPPRSRCWPRMDPTAMQRGRLAEAIVATLQARGSTMTLEDLAAHTVDEPTPLVGSYRGVQVLELPPPTQGSPRSRRWRSSRRSGPLPSDPALATHLQIEAVRAAMADRQEHLADPDAMRTSPEALLAPARVRAIADAIDPTAWPLATRASGAQGGPPTCARPIATGCSSA